MWSSPRSDRGSSALLILPIVPRDLAPRGAPASGSSSESEARQLRGPPSGPARSAEDRGAHRW
jgi:hypothetical protein